MGDRKPAHPRDDSSARFEARRFFEDWLEKQRSAKKGVDDK